MRTKTIVKIDTLNVGDKFITLDNYENDSLNDNVFLEEIIKIKQGSDDYVYTVDVEERTVQNHQRNTNMEVIWIRDIDIPGAE